MALHLWHGVVNDLPEPTGLISVKFDEVDAERAKAFPGLPDEQAGSPVVRQDDREAPVRQASSHRSIADQAVVLDDPAGPQALGDLEEPDRGPRSLISRIGTDSHLIAAILPLVPTSPTVPPEAREAILAWYATNGRRLAFRGTSDPYAILVSEVIAQQTQAARAAEHWQRFMARFPTVAALAAASSADVQRAWQGLGYNRRALALWRAARLIESEHGGTIPDSPEALERLPGVGPYTARAVAAIAFGRAVGAVDVNVRRVLGRMVAGGPGALGAPEMQTLADRAVPHNRAADWTHAVMDVGALLCRPRSPRCSDCPASQWCRYAAREIPDRRLAVRQGRQRRANAPFPSTTRWLRGRILDRLRAAPGDSWVTIDAAIGTHDVRRVRDAADSMAADGLIEIDQSAAVMERFRARLATN